VPTVTTSLAPPSVRETKSANCTVQLRISLISCTVFGSMIFCCIDRLSGGDRLVVSGAGSATACDESSPFRLRSVETA